VEAHLAGLTPTGGTSDLYEGDTTLDKVIADLGLIPIPVDEKETLRSELTVIHWRGTMEFVASKKQNTIYRLQPKISRQL
jgi:hypothetical protein